MKHVKPFTLNETISNNLVSIATNDIHWSWEYDSVITEAIVYFDSKSINGDLYLDIIRTSIKTGIGAGRHKKILVDKENVGNVKKPEYKKIRSLLTKNKYSSDLSFKRQWTKPDGEKLALSKIISTSRFIKLTLLKNKVKNNNPKMETPNANNNIKIMEYGRGYVVYGSDTKKIKDDLKKLGAKFNFRLTFPETGEKFSGWVFSPSKLEEVKKLINYDINETYSQEYISNLKYGIFKSYNEEELFEFFTDEFYDEFFEIIVEDSDLEYMDSELDKLKLEFANACSAYINDKELKTEIKFLQEYLNNKEYNSNKTLSYDDLNDNSKKIYNNLDIRLDTIFWVLIEQQI